MVWVAQKTFAFGELNPTLFGNTGTNQYRGGCEKLENALVTRFGGARKRDGTGLVGQTYQDQASAIFQYSALGSDFILEVSANDVTQTDRVIRVWDVATRALISPFDSAAEYGPFPASGSDQRAVHHFLEAELDDVQSFQHQNRVYLLHPDHPPLYLERRTGGGTESWVYDVAPASDQPPIIVDNANQTTITLTGSTQIDSDAPLFNKGDLDTYWRIEGPSGVAASFMGIWFKVTEVVDSTRANGNVVYGVLDAERRDPTDWCGPFVASPTLTGTATIDSTSNFINDVRQFTLTGAALLNTESRAIGRKFTVNGVLWACTGINGSNDINGIRLEGSGVSILGGGVTFNWHYLAYGEEQSRPHVTRQQIFPTRTTGPGGAAVVELWQENDPLGDWLPTGTETTVDTILDPASNQEFDVGGTVHMNGGILAIYEKDVNLGQGTGTSYKCIELEPIRHDGTSLHWSLGWSAGVGFPRCGTSHQGRVFFGGFKGNPSRVVASRTFNPEDFITGPNDDDPLNFEVNDPEGGLVSWMVSAQDLLLGTARSEFAIKGDPITSNQLGVDRQSGYGGSLVAPVLASSNALFVDADQRGIREMSFVFERDRYQSPDLTDLSTHLFDGKKIIRIASMVAPDSYIATLFSDGTMAALTYRRENGIVAWSPWIQPSHPINGDNGTTTELSTVESIAVNRDSGSLQRDELWLVRKWKSDGYQNAGTEVRTIEIMSDEFDMDQEAVFGTPTTIGAPAGALTSLYASGAPTIVNDGVFIGNYITDALGAVVWFVLGYTVAPTESRVGMPITFSLTPLVPQFSLPGQGDTDGRTKNVSSVIVLLTDSRGGTIEGKQIGTQSIPETIVIDSIDPIDGWYTVYGVGEFGQRASVALVQDNPYPFEIGAINMDVDYGTGTS